MLWLMMVGFMLLSTNAYADTCVDTSGDAAIVNGDVPSSRLEAVERAKWAAIEQVAGVQIHASSLVQDFALVDDNVVKKTNGTIRSYKVLDGKRDGDIYHARIHACVSPAAAERSVGGLARNTAVGVLIVSRSRKENAVVESAHARWSRDVETLHLDRDPYSAAVKQGLIDQDVQVIDVADALGIDGARLARSLQRGDNSLVRKIMLKSMANVFVFGQIDNVISTRKGADIGYGLSMPLHRVTSHLTYKIFSRGSDGAVRVIRSDTNDGVGMALALEDANQQAMKSLAKHAAGQVVDSIVRHIKGKSRVVDVVVDGVPGVDAHEVIKDGLNRIQWIMAIQDISAGHFKIKSPERVLYLANSLQRIQGLKVTDFTDLTIHAKYSAP